MASTMPSSMAMNATNSSLAQDILFAFPRLARRAGVFAINYLPEQFDGFIGKVLAPGRIIPDPTSITSTVSNLSVKSTSTAYLGIATSTAVETATAAATAGAQAQASSFLSISALLNLMRGVTSFSSYIISKWALTTAIMVFTLGRIHVFASSRIPLRLNFVVRAAVYSLPIAFLIYQSQAILQAIRCQTSPDWSLMRYKNASKHLSLDFAGHGGFLYRLASSALYWETDQASCQAVDMAALDKGQTLRGSLSLLWPLFLALCGSHFAETIASALQGRQPVTENSIFEMSLAFAEAEALVTKPFELSILSGKITPDSSLPMKINTVKRVMNVTPEVLLLSLIFALSTISSNVLAVFNKRKKWRLVNTGVWGIAYMAAFIWSVSHLFSMDDDAEWNFRFPTVFVISFLPHLVIIFGTIVCACIYAIGLLVTVLSPPPGEPNGWSFKQRVQNAYNNLQANVYLAAGEHIRFSWEDEFYSTLLKAGFTLLTVASEAVYLNEGTNIHVNDLTWLERKRVDELSKHQGILFRKTKQSIPPAVRHSMAGAFPFTQSTDQHLPDNNSGYARERKARARSKGNEALDLGNQNYTLAERRSYMAVRFVQGVFWLWTGALVRSFVFVLEKLGITYRPRWLRKLVGSDVPKQQQSTEPLNAKHIEFWMLKDDGTFHLATDMSVDVETEMRKQRERGMHSRRIQREEELNDDIYSWWKLGGFFGEADASGEYQPTEPDDDVTSVISSSSTGWRTDDDDWTDEEEGQRTPTKHDPFPSQAQGRNDLVDPETLASLLDPQTMEEQHEARMLSRRLRTSGVLTRQRYQRQLDMDRASILTTSRAFNPERKNLDREEEESRLEQFIFEKRSAITTQQRQQYQADPSSSGPSWSAGAPGMGNAGPMCVVCQDAPRTILLWPCGCLSMCDDCRVSMATRNFTNCVCCRTATEAFSRLYVP